MNPKEAVTVEPKIKAIMDWLVGQGASVELGTREQYELKGVEDMGQVQCVDGRAPVLGQEIKQRGPKFPGGIEGVAYFVAKQAGARAIAKEHVKTAIEKVKQLGFAPGLHDMSDDHLHCGHAGLVRDGKFETAMTLAITPDEIAGLAVEDGGQNPVLSGTHQETKVILNFASGMTRDPNGEQQMFCVDLWFAKQLGIDEVELAQHAAETVQKLGSQAWSNVVIIV